MPRPRTSKYSLPAGPAAILIRRVASNLTATRDQAGLSQQQLATAARLSLQSVSRVERAHGRTNLETLALLADALNISPAALLQ